MRFFINTKYYSAFWIFALAICASLRALAKQSELLISGFFRFIKTDCFVAPPRNDDKIQYAFNHFFYRTIVLIFLLSMINFEGIAQSVEPLPDSVRAVEDTVIASSPDVSTSDSQKINNAIADTAVLRSVPDSVNRIYKKDKDFAYANDAAYWAKEPPSDDKNFWYYFMAFVSSAGVRIFVYILIAAVLLFAFYKIVVENKLYLFYSAPKKMSVTEKEDTILEIEDFDEKIHRSMRAQDYRLAIRWMYLKALRVLDEKGLIHFHEQATNQEYVSQLSKHQQGGNFKYLTNVYDYAWYGGFVLTEQQAEKMQQNFNQFYTEIKN
jgi:hypothetical protein